MAEGRMNLAALQQRDPYISEIEDTASQVALYSFNSTSNEWEKTSIEGSLFIYKRSASPVHGFMILNRLGLNNLVEPLTKHLEFQQQDPFLLYRNAKSIYGVWFYDKDECKRLGGKLNSYVHEILTEEQQKGALSSAVTEVATVATAAGITASMAGAMAPSQVDIMQMLSKAQKEYDTGSKKTEPKPMIDNPNASAMKVTNIIRPQPLKIPDSESTETEEVSDSVTPGVITLAALFRTASLQQGTAGLQQTTVVTQKSTSSSKSATDSYYSSGQDYRSQRSISVSGTQGAAPAKETGKSAEEGDLPPLLKHIMSTGSMVEDIERQHLRGRGAAGGDKLGTDSAMTGSALPGGLPDLTQPPPNHPAYRGPSPQTQSMRSPRETYSASSRPKSCSDYRSDLSSDKGLSGLSSSTANSQNISGSFSGLPATVTTSQILSGNLLPIFSSMASSQPSNAQSMGQSVSQSIPTSKNLSSETLFGSRVSPKVELEGGARQKIDPSPVFKTSALLTPADILQSVSSYQSSSVTSSTNTTVSQDKPINPNLATAAASLSTELLSPMAFTSSTTRKTPPTSVMIERSVSYDDRSHDQSKDFDVLPVAALTKEQLQQSLLSLLKNDSDFINTIHEAYLKSLQERARGPKS